MLFACKVCGKEPEESFALVGDSTKYAPNWLLHQHGWMTNGEDLYCPDHDEDSFVSQKCTRCKGPFHPATGHAFKNGDLACGPCAGRFWAWVIQRDKSRKHGRRGRWRKSKYGGWSDVGGGP